MSDAVGASNGNGKPKMPTVLQVSILVNPETFQMQIQHPGADRPAVLQILGEAVKLVARQHALDLVQAAQTKVQVAGAGALRGLPPELRA